MRHALLAFAVAGQLAGSAPPSNRIVEKLEQGRPAMGTVNRQAPRSLAAARALAGRDVDFAVFDVEGGVTDLTQFEASLRVLRDPAVLGPSRRPVSPLVRIPRSSNHAPETVVREFLALGVSGVMFGHIDSRADAERAVAAVRAGRSAGQGEPVAIMMIESPEAAKNAAEIARVPGVTALFFGPGDFSRAIGKQARLPEIDPEVEAAVQAMLAACRAQNIACGYPAAARSRELLEAEVAKRLSQGFRIVTQVDLREF